MLCTEQTVAENGEPVYQPLRYLSQYVDAGRFVSQDPIGLAAGVNLYQYAPNPLSWIEPLGLSKCTPNKKTTYEGVSRRDAFRKAKRDAGVPNNQQPFEVSRVKLGDGYDDFIKDKNDIPVETRQYHLKMIMGQPW